MKDLIKNTVLFSHEYRSMENAPVKVGKNLIRAVIEDRHRAEHLCDSWAGRNGDFGSFFLNLSHETQGLFMEYWGIPVSELAEYSRRKEENPISVMENLRVEEQNYYAQVDDNANVLWGSFSPVDLAKDIAERIIKKLE